MFYLDSATGNDSNNGLSATAAGTGIGPGRSLAKLAALALQPGDTVQLVCGSVWNETLRVAASGTATSPITVTSCLAGCTNMPATDGSTSITASAWTLHSGNIEKATLASTPLQVFSSAGNMTIAHHPMPDSMRDATVGVPAQCGGVRCGQSQRPHRQHLSHHRERPGPAGLASPSRRAPERASARCPG